MIDVSDGLIADLGHVASASGVLIRLNWDLIVGRPRQALARWPRPPTFWAGSTGGSGYWLAATTTRWWRRSRQGPDCQNDGG